MAHTTMMTMPNGDAMHPTTVAFIANPTPSANSFAFGVESLRFFIVGIVGVWCKRDGLLPDLSEIFLKAVELAMIQNHR